MLWTLGVSSTSEASASITWGGQSPFCQLAQLAGSDKAGDTETLGPAHLLGQPGLSQGHLAQMGWLAGLGNQWVAELSRGKGTRAWGGAPGS